ncbi:MAG: glycosyltransferase family 4 protein [bacterium]
MRSALKICLVSDFFLPGIGGVEYVVHYLAEALVRKGCQVEVLAPSVPEEKKSYRVTRLKSFCSEYKENIELDYRINLGLVYARSGFDVINAHFVYPSGYAAAAWGKSRGVPVVVTTHGVDVQRIPELSYGLTYDIKIKKKTVAALSQADLVTSPSLALWKSSVDLAGNPEKNLRIPHGIDPRIFQAGYSGDLKTPYIIYLGRLQKMKGVNLLIESFKKVISVCPDLRLLIVGDGEERVNLVEQSLKAELSGKIIFTGVKTGREKFAALAGAELLVCPSLKEAFGIAVTEAMALGLPVVGFDTAGVNELVKHGYNGFLAPKYDTAMLAGHIIKLLQDKKTARIFSRRNRRDSRRFHWDTVSKSYLDAYFRVV